MTAYYSFLGLILQGLLVNLIFAITPAEGQNLRDVKVSVNVVNVSLEQALQIIESKTNFKFIFFEEGLPLTAKATVIVDDESLYNILEVFAKDYGLTFNRINDQIVVKKSQGQAENLVTAIETGTVKGKVTDAKTGEALIGASVIIKGTKQGASVNVNGNYAIYNVNAGNYTIVATMVGYSPKERTVSVKENTTAELNFQLDQKEINMKEVVVTTSTVIPTPIRKLPNTISIVTSNDIEKINPANVAEVIRMAVPGAIYSDEGVGTTYGAFSVRGVSSIQGAASTLKVYIDGVEASDPAYVTYMDPSSIQRVEVVPGPQASTIYGSRAISGVMQIFTKHGISGDAKISGKVGMKSIDNKYVPDKSPLGQEYAINANGGVSIFDYNLGVNYKNEAPWIDLFAEQSLNLSGSTRFTLGDLTGGLSINFSKLNNSSGWDPLNYKRDKELNRTLTPPNRVTESAYQTYSFSLNYKAAESWTHNMTLGFNGLSRFSYDRSPNATTKLYSVSKSFDQRLTFSYNTSFQAELNQLFGSSLTLGTDWSQWSLPFFSGSVADRTNYVFIDQNEGKKVNLGFYGQTQISYSDFLFFTAGLRSDRYPSGSNQSFAWSPRLGISSVYEREEWMVKGRIAWGQSIIIPDGSNITGTESATYAILPNPGLLSQIQRGFEIGADLYYSSTISLNFTYFNQNPLNLIEMINLGKDNLNRTLYQYQNVDEVKNEGFEIKAIAQPYDWLTLNFNYGQNKSTIVQLGPTYTGGLKVGDQLTGQPKYTFSTTIDVTPIEGTTITLAAFQFGEWIAADFYGYLYDVYGGKYNPAVKSYPSGYYITYPGYTKINVGVTQKITDILSGYLQVQNLTNTENFERLNAIVTQPRTIIFGIMFNGITL